jgi:FtsZ-binding cell division protein ZapB
MKKRIKTITLLGFFIASFHLAIATTREDSQARVGEQKVALVFAENNLEKKNKELVQALKEASAKAKMLQEKLDQQKQLYENRLKEQSGFFETKCEKHSEDLKKLQLEYESIKNENARLSQENFSKASLIDELKEPSPTLVFNR